MYMCECFSFSFLKSIWDDVGQTPTCVSQLKTQEDPQLLNLMIEAQVGTRQSHTGKRWEMGKTCCVSN